MRVFLVAIALATIVIVALRLPTQLEEVGGLEGGRAAPPASEAPEALAPADLAAFESRADAQGNLLREPAESNAAPPRPRERESRIQPDPRAVEREQRRARALEAQLLRVRAEYMLAKDARTKAQLVDLLNAKAVLEQQVPTDGFHVALHPSGKTAAQGRIRNGKREGLWLEYHGNEERASEGAYHQGKKHGAWTYWHATGERKAEGSYLYGEREGFWREWHPSGTLRSTATHRDGALEGSTRRFHSNGALAADGEHVDGAREGIWLTHHPNGELESRGRYIHGKRQGRFEYRLPDGSENTDLSGVYENDVKTH